MNFTKRSPPHNQRTIFEEQNGSRSKLDGTELRADKFAQLDPETSRLSKTRLAMELAAPDQYLPVACLAHRWQHTVPLVYCRAGILAQQNQELGPPTSIVSGDKAVGHGLR